MTRYRHTLRLAGRTVPIHTDPHIYNERGTELLGESCFRPLRRIRLSGTISGIARTETIVHEAIHQLSNLYAAKLTERQTGALEAGIIDLIRSNPWLVRLVQGAR